jgi:hypothetical protein
VYSYDARNVNKNSFFDITFFTKKVFFWGGRPFFLKKGVKKRGS